MKKRARSSSRTRRASSRSTSVSRSSSSRKQPQTLTQLVSKIKSEKSKKGSRKSRSSKRSKRSSSSLGYFDSSSSSSSDDDYGLYDSDDDTLSDILGSSSKGSAATLLSQSLRQNLLKKINKDVSATPAVTVTSSKKISTSSASAIPKVYRKQLKKFPSLAKALVESASAEKNQKKTTTSPLAATVSTPSPPAATVSAPVVKATAPPVVEVKPGTVPSSFATAEFKQKVTQVKADTVVPTTQSTAMFKTEFTPQGQRRRLRDVDLDPKLQKPNTKSKYHPQLLDSDPSGSPVYLESNAVLKFLKDLKDMKWYTTFAYYFGQTKIDYKPGWNISNNGERTPYSYLMTKVALEFPDMLVEVTGANISADQEKSVRNFEEAIKETQEAEPWVFVPKSMSLSQLDVNFMFDLAKLIEPGEWESFGPKDSDPTGDINYITGVVNVLARRVKARPTRPDTVPPSEIDNDGLILNDGDLDWPTFQTNTIKKIVLFRMVAKYYSTPAMMEINKLRNPGTGPKK
jgi:hypothetical protein